MNRKNIISLIIIVLVIAAVGYVVLNGLNIGMYIIEPATRA